MQFLDHLLFGTLLVTQLQETILCQGQPDHHGASSASFQAYPKKKLCKQRQRDTERVQQLRVEYWHEIGEVKLENLVFIDETGSNLTMTLALWALS